MPKYPQIIITRHEECWAVRVELSPFNAFGFAETTLDAIPRTIREFCPAGLPE